MTVDRHREHGEGPPPRLFVATDVRLIPLGDGRYASTHPSVNDDALERYRLTDWSTTLVARTVDPGTASRLETLSASEVEVSPLPGDSKSQLMPLRVVRLLKQLWRLPVSRDDVVVVRLPELVSSVLWLRARWARAVVVSNVVADARALADAFGPASVVARPIVTALARLMVRASSAVVYVTQGQLQGVYPAQHGKPTLSASNVRLATDSFAAKPRQYQSRDPDEPVKLIAVGGQNGPWKGHDLLILAVRHLLDSGVEARLELLGDGSSQQDLRALATRLGVADRVAFRGFVADREALKHCLDRADFFVMPSRLEGLPRAMIEAMARGLCCAGARVGGIPELTPDEALFAPDNSDALAACLMRLIGSPATASRLAERQWKLAKSIAESATPDRFARFLLQVWRGRV